MTFPILVFGTAYQSRKGAAGEVRPGADLGPRTALLLPAATSDRTLSSANSLPDHEISRGERLASTVFHDFVIEEGIPLRGAGEGATKGVAAQRRKLSRRFLPGFQPKDSNFGPKARKFNARGLAPSSTSTMPQQGAIAAKAWSRTQESYRRMTQKVSTGPPNLRSSLQRMPS